MPHRSGRVGLLRLALKAVFGLVAKGVRSEKFFDHFSQATLFWNSQSEPEKAHLVNALELGKVKGIAIRERMVGMLAQVDKSLANRMAKVSDSMCQLNHSVSADGNVKQLQPKPVNNSIGLYEARREGGKVPHKKATKK